MKTSIMSPGYFDLEDYEEGLKKLKKHGYDCIDFQSMMRMESPIYTWEENKVVDFFTGMKRFMDEQGLEVYQAHGLWPKNDMTNEDREGQVPYYIRELKICQLLGCKYLVIHPIMPYGWEEETDSEFSWKVNKEFVQKLLPYAKKYDVVLCFENIPLRMQLGHVEYIKKFIREISDPNLKACLDTGHANIMKDDIYDSIVLLGEDLKCVHVHDNFGINDEHISPFFGRINWDKFTEGLKKINYNSCISLETLIHANAYDEIKEKLQINLSKTIRLMADRIDKKS